MKKHLLLGIVAMGCLLMGASCKKKPDLTFPTWLPYSSYMPVQAHTYVCPCFDSYGNRYLCTGYPFSPFKMSESTYNEFYSVTRWDSLLQDSLSIFWNKDFFNHLNCFRPTFPFGFDSLYCPPKVGEQITIYRFQCNRSKHDFKFETKHRAVMSMIKKDGLPDEIDTDYMELEPIPAKTCIPLTMKITYGGVGSYELTSTADVDNDVPEDDENNNVLHETELDNLNSGN